MFYQIVTNMKRIRLFTSGKHNGLDFSNENIKSIAAKTASKAPDKIPIVLGHPKNDLPVVGWLPKTFIQQFAEGEKLSLGFERANADFSEPALAAIKAAKADKISIRLTDGVITHIGLVEKAAVEENNSQEFETGDVFLHGLADFATDTENQSSMFTDFLKKFDAFFKKNEEPKKQEEGKQTENADANADKIAEFTATMEAMKKQIEFSDRKLKFNARFATKPFNIPTVLIDKAAHVAANLSDADSVVFTDLLTDLSKPALPPNGSVVTAHGNTDDFNKTDLQSEINKQLNALR